MIYSLSLLFLWEKSVKSHNTYVHRDVVFFYNVITVRSFKGLNSICLFVLSNEQRDLLSPFSLPSSLRRVQEIPRTLHINVRNTDRRRKEMETLTGSYGQGLRQLTGQLTTEQLKNGSFQDRDHSRRLRSGVRILIPTVFFFFFLPFCPSGQYILKLYLLLKNTYTGFIKYFVRCLLKTNEL